MRTVEGTATFERVSRVYEQRWARVRVEVPDGATDDEVAEALEAEAERVLRGVKAGAPLEDLCGNECSDWDEAEADTLDHEVIEVKTLVPEGAP